MADYYSQCIVQPSLPGWLIDKADRLALEGLGYTFEEDVHGWYLFAAEGENSAAWGINPNDWLEVFDEGSVCVKCWCFTNLLFRIERRWAPMLAATRDQHLTQT